MTSKLETLDQQDMVIRRNNKYSSVKFLAKFYQNVATTLTTTEEPVLIMAKLRLVLLEEDPTDQQIGLLNLKLENPTNYKLHLAIAFYFTYLDLDPSMTSSILNKLSVIDEFKEATSWSLDQIKQKMGPFFYEIPQFPQIFNSISLPEVPKEDENRDTNYESITVNEKQYKLIRIIGHGQNSRVYLALNKDASDLCALKVTDISDLSQSAINMLHDECRFLMQDYEGRVITIYDSEKRIDKFIIVMEYGELDLIHYAHKLFVLNSNRTSPRQILPNHVLGFIWLEMLNCVSVLHKKNIIHLDLKLENIIICNGVLKLIDLGISQRCPGDESKVGAIHQLGTTSYCSPERIKSVIDPGCGIKIGYKSDVWSLGICLYYLIYGKYPYSPKMTEDQVIDCILDKKFVVNCPRNPNHSVFLQCIKRSLVWDYSSRANVDELISLMQKSF